MPIPGGQWPVRVPSSSRRDRPIPSPIPSPPGARRAGRLCAGDDIVRGAWTQMSCKVWTWPCPGVLAQSRVTPESRRVPALHGGPRGTDGRRLITRRRAGPGANRPEHAMARASHPCARRGRGNRTASRWGEKPSEGSVPTGSCVHTRAPGGEGGVWDRTDERTPEVGREDGGCRCASCMSSGPAAGSRAAGAGVWGRVGPCGEDTSRRPGHRILTSSQTTHRGGRGRHWGVTRGRCVRTHAVTTRRTHNTGQHRTRTRNTHTAGYAGTLCAHQRLVRVV